MRHGFIKVAAVTPKIKVADPVYNRERICEGIREAADQGARLVVFPELCLSGYTCGDLFLQERLLTVCREQLSEIADCSRDVDALLFVGLPLLRERKLYNTAAVIYKGEVLAFIPKSFLPSFGEFYETRHFCPGNREPVFVPWEGKQIPVGTDILFRAEGMEGLLIGCEICEDLWTADPPSTRHALAGATVLVNLSASNETIGKDAYREMLVKSCSARLIAGYVYCSAGEGESTQDMVFGGHDLIAENGVVLARTKLFENQILYADLDMGRLSMERRRIQEYSRDPGENRGYLVIPFSLACEETRLARSFPSHPFVPSDKAERDKRCEEILAMQVMGLKKRYEHTGCGKAVVGVSGGLDSTLALLVTARTFDMLGIPRRNIFAVTMPCFGTTDRTYENACKMAKALGTTLREIPIREAVTVHFKDIGQKPDRHDVTYENAQARERTQVLMDLANQENALVIGTGDMSELALGWATYNGDHMSMYGVNAGIPKTLVRHLVGYYADLCGKDGSGSLREVLLDVLDTPVSPELLPPVEGEICQKTEDLVGPYELHDFFLYYMLRWGFAPDKIYRLAQKAFEGQYDKAVILKWMKTFYRRFFSQQFKRSCMPDGPKVGSVALSPRGDLRMPSDACGEIWLKQLEDIRQ